MNVIEYKPTKLEEAPAVCTGVNARFPGDKTVSLLIVVGDPTDTTKLAPGSRGGTLATMAVTESLFDQGLRPGAQMFITGVIEASAQKRADGQPWLRIRPEKVVVTRRGHKPADENVVSFADSAALTT